MSIYPMQGSIETHCNLPIKKISSRSIYNSQELQISFGLLDMFIELGQREVLVYPLNIE